MEGRKSHPFLLLSSWFLVSFFIKRKINGPNACSTVGFWLIQKFKRPFKWNGFPAILLLVQQFVTKFQMNNVLRMYFGLKTESNFDYDSKSKNLYEMHDRTFYRCHWNHKGIRHQASNIIKQCLKHSIKNECIKFTRIVIMLSLWCNEIYFIIYFNSTTIGCSISVCDSLAMIDVTLTKCNLKLNWMLTFTRWFWGIFSLHFYLMKNRKNIISFDVYLFSL